MTSVITPCKTCGHPLASHHGERGKGPCMMQAGTYGTGGPCGCTSGTR